MSSSWVALAVRARALSRRRAGADSAREVAAATSLEAALALLGGTPYGEATRAVRDLAEAQHAVVDAFAWNLRVLAGWAPRQGVAGLRAASAVLEIANTDALLRRLAGGADFRPYALGGLATAWPRLGTATTIAELRQTLRTTAWGDPGSESLRDIGLAMRVALADRVLATTPPAAAWAGGALALLLARESAPAGRALPARARAVAARAVGRDAVAASSLPELVAALPADARWALAGVAGPAELWRAEVGWWRRLERDGALLLRRAPGPEPALGAVALLAVDAWRLRAALELAARGGGPLEVLDAAA